MKIKQKSAFGLVIIILTIFSLMFSGCDEFLEWLFEDVETESTCAHTWTWVVTTPATDAANGVRTERCSKCRASSGRTQVIPKLGSNYPSTPLESGGYGLVLRVFSANATTVPHFETFTVKYRLRNSGSEQFPINGQFGIALINNDNSIAGIVGTRDYGWALDTGFSTSETEMTCNMPITVTPGQYQLRVIVRPAGGEWRIVSTSIENAPTSISFQVLVNNNIVVAPLLQTKWSQGSPYNDLFPYLPDHSKADSRNGRLVTDCGTTAVTQLIAFYKYPARAIGQSSTLGPHGISMSPVNFENYPFDWANMRNTFTNGDPGTTQERKAVAELMFIFGMARSDGTIGFPKILVENFGYDRGIQQYYRGYYTDAEWEALIRQQLDAGFPVYYYGNYPTDAASSDGYHAFVVDGYDKTGKFHANWGWAGSYDGWYFINDFDPQAPASTYANERIFINIKPDAGNTGTNEFALVEFTSSSTSVTRSVQFTATINLRSCGYFPGGQAGIALVDNNNNIITDIGRRSLGNNWQPGSRATMEMNCTVPGTVNAGQYSLKVVTRETDGEWKIVTLSDRVAGTPNSINVTVQ